MVSRSSFIWRAVTMMRSWELSMAATWEEREEGLSTYSSCYRVLARRVAPMD